MENSFLPDKERVAHLVFNLRENKRKIFYAFGVFIFLFFFYYFFFSAPRNFPTGDVIRIEKGASLLGVSSLLKKENIIRSRVIFESFAIIFGGELHIVSADYLFEDKIPVWKVALRIVKGEHGTPPVSVTIPEGFDINQIADIFSKKLTNFKKDKFLSDAKNKEGYLFPDTYFFLNDANERDVIKSMSNNFNKKITLLDSDIILSGKTKEEIITMASIVEREAKGDVDRDVISGILWKRIKINMPLQVDAAPITYKMKGLPPGPIGNPGLEAIRATLYPKSSSYLYYLHDKNGIIHYARNFSEHNANIQKYLK